MYNIFLTEISFVTFFLDFAWFSVRQRRKTIQLKILNNIFKNIKN